MTQPPSQLSTLRLKGVLTLRIYEQKQVSHAMPISPLLNVPWLLMLTPIVATPISSHEDPALDRTNSWQHTPIEAYLGPHLRVQPSGVLFTNGWELESRERNSREGNSPLVSRHRWLEHIYESLRGRLQEVRGRKYHSGMQSGSEYIKLD